MAEHIFDPSGVATSTLRAAVDQQGSTVLTHVAVLRNALSDVRASSPREAAVLVSAADGGVADLLAQQVEQHQMDATSAIRLTAGLLGRRTALDPQACTWATTAFAHALGFVEADAGALAAGREGAGADASPASLASGPTPAGDGTPTGPGPTPTAPGPSPAQPGPTPTAPGPSPAQPGPTPTAPARAPPTRADADRPGAGIPRPGRRPWSPAGRQGPTGSPPAPPTPAAPAPAAPTPAAPAPAAPTPAGPPPRGPGRRTTVAVIGSSVGLVVALLVYVGVAAGTHLPPFDKSSGTPASTSSAPTTTAPPTVTTKSLSQLLPADIDRSACESYKTPVAGLTGLTQSLRCLDSSLPGGTVFALKFANAGDYTKSVAAFNAWIGFHPTGPAASCPTTTAGGQGQAPWDDTGFPSAPGQNVECFPVGTNLDTPVFAWLYPTEWAILDAQGAPGSSSSTLNQWWTAHGDAPGAR